MLPYLNSERNIAADELVYNAHGDQLRDAKLKGKIQAFDAILGLVDYLYSVEIKKQETGTEVE